MPKKNRQRPQREPTRRQLARWQREKKRQRIIHILGVTVIVAVIAIVGAGAYLASYRPLHETIMTVNGTRFDMSYYINVLKYYSRNQDPSNVYTIANYVATVIEQNELIKQGAAQLGFTVSNEEADKELARLKLDKQYRDLVRKDLLVKKLLNEYFDGQVPLKGEQRQVQAMFLESQSQVRDVTSKLAAGKSFNELASELSLDTTTKTKKGDLGWHTKDVFSQAYTPVLADYAFDSEVGVLSPPVADETKPKGVGYWLIKILEKQPDADDTHVLGIQLGSEEQARMVKARLDAGEDFAKLAGEFSHLEDSKNKGGDLNWVRPGMLNPAVNDYIFKSGAPRQTVSNPIRDDKAITTGGYWLIEVLARDENRKIDDEDRQALKNKTLTDWIQSLMANPDNKVENLLDNEKISWAVNKATEKSTK